jgi:hypothetical protein
MDRVLDKAERDHQKAWKKQLSKKRFNAIEDIITEFGIEAAVLLCNLNPVLALSSSAVLMDDGIKIGGRNKRLDKAGKMMADYMDQDVFIDGKEAEKKNSLEDLQKRLGGVAQKHTENVGINEIKPEDDLKKSIGKVTEFTRQIIEHNTGRADFEEDLKEAYSQGGDKALKHENTDTEATPSTRSAALGL